MDLDGMYRKLIITFSMQIPFEFHAHWRKKKYGEANESERNRE